MSLKERRDIVSLYRDAHATVAGGVLFSVVRVSGSSYRQPGARMLVLADGRTAGTLSGGCLEADLLRRAAWTVRGGAVVERFSTAFDDTAEIPYGLGCGGEIDLLAEPLNTPEAEALLQAFEATLAGEERTIATLLPADGAAEAVTALRRVVLDAGGDVLFASESLPTEAVVEVRYLTRRSVRENGGSRWAESLPGILVTERLLPVQRLLIFGAGEDARPLARMTAELGWLPIVVDARANRATPERFPEAACMTCTSAAAVPVLSTDVVVLMTHSYQQDRQLLAELLRQPPAYLGLLGARHRSALLLSEASELSGVPLGKAVEQTHAPIGLELGGEGPEAVALAVVAEVQQALSSQGAGRSVFPRRLELADVERLLRESPPSSIHDACARTVDATQAVPQ